MPKIPLPRSAKAMVLATVLSLCAVGSLSACAGAGPFSFGSQPCMPPEYSVSPAEARPGAEVVVSAPAATCNPRYGENARIAVTVTDPEGSIVLDAKGPMSDDGAFEFTFTVPQDMTAGTFEISAVPADVDWCDDTGTNNRLNNSEEFERTSCFLPTRPLQVTR